MRAHHGHLNVPRGRGSTSQTQAKAVGECLDTLEVYTKDKTHAAKHAMPYLLEANGVSEASITRVGWGGDTVAAGNYMKDVPIDFMVALAGYAFRCYPSELIARNLIVVLGSITFHFLLHRLGVGTGRRPGRRPGRRRGTGCEGPPRHPR